MKKTMICGCIAASLLGCNGKAISTAADVEKSHEFLPLGNKTVLTGDYPRAFFFRLPQRKMVQSYEDWAHEFGRANGMLVKVGIEEIAALPHEKVMDYMNRFAKENPEKLVTLHYNSFAHDPHSIEPGVFAPQHWLWLPGKNPSKDLKATDKVVIFDESLEGVFVDDGKFGRYSDIKDDVLIIEVDKNGNRNWDHYEYATVEKVDGDKLKLKRGQFGTVARDWKAGSFYVAPVASMGPYGSLKENNNKLWVYNITELAPKDASGNHTADVIAERLADLLDKDGPLSHIGAVAFDLPFFDIEPRKFSGRRADANNDGIEDGAVIDNVNYWGEGTHTYYAKVKAKFGDNKILTADTQYIFNQRAVDVLDGMEHEGVIDHADGYKASANTLNHFTYFQRFNKSKLAYNYTFYKDKSKDQHLPHMQKGRWGFTLVQALGETWGINNQYEDVHADQYNGGTIVKSDNGYFFQHLDELNKGEENVYNWLGQPIGDMRRLGMEAESYWTDDFLTHVKAVNADIEIRDGELIVKSKYPHQNKTRFVFKDMELPEGDMLLYYDTKALTKLVLGDSKQVDSPYQVEISVKGLKSEEHKPHHPILAYTGPEDYHTNMAYFREAGPSKVDIEVIINGGAGEWSFKNFHLSNAVPAIVREFEHGVVLNNPSVSEYCFDTAMLFPSAKLKRIKGKQNPALNNGEKVVEPVCLKSLNGIVLSKYE